MAKATVYKPLQPYKPLKTPFPDIKVTFSKTYISASASSDGATTDVYEVPEGKIFLLIAFSISGVADNASGGGELELQTTDPNIPELIRLRCKSSPAAGETFNPMQSLSLSEPIKFPQGTTFRIYNGSSMEMCGTIIGYLVDKNAESLFYLN